MLFVLPAQYYAESGRSYPDQFRGAGYAVTIASGAEQVVEVCENTVRADQPAKNIPVDLSFAEVQVAEYDAIIFIGGLGCQDQWQDEEAHHIAQEAVSRKKVLGAAGCASTILAYAGVLQGKTAAVCPDNPPVKHNQDYCAVLQSQGAICSQEQITRDGLIVTARQKSPYFVAGVIQVIAESSPPASIPLLQKSPQEFDSRGTFQAGLGDLDGDGDLDAVFANPQRHNSQVWLNDGSGTLVDTGQQLTQYGHGVGIADFDGDGDLDAFIACHQFVTPSKVYLNDGTGLFRDSGQDLGDKSISATEVNLFDLNGDGHTDVHVMYYDPNGLPDRVYLNDGHAAFTDSGLALNEETIAWGDLDADGDVDYFGKRWGQGYVVQINDGSGRFNEGWRMEDSRSTGGGVALADLDGDGDLDALVTNGFRDTGSFPSILLWNGGSGQFGDSGQRLDATLLAELAVGDLDGDGDPDVIVSNMDLPNEVWLNDGGRFVDSGLRLGDNSDMSSKPSLGDLDGDGDLDLFVGSLAGRPEIWFNTTVVTPTAAPGAPMDGPTSTWIRTFEGPNYGRLFDIVLTEDGSILAVGATNHLHVPPYSGDTLLTKLTLEGDLLWERNWGGDGYEQAVSVVPAEDGGYYVFGETDSYGAGDRDFFVLKITADGSEDWFKTYGGARREWPYGMLRLSNGDLLIYGFTETAGTGRDQYALRLSPAGEVIWGYTVEIPGEELVLDALETAEGDLVLAVIFEEDGGLVRLSADGNVRWTKRYELTGWQYASQVAETDDGRFLLVGFSMSSGSRRQVDTWIARCTSTGDLEWETSFGELAFDDYATSLIRLEDGTYLVGSLANGMLLSRVDQDGNVLWRRSLVGKTVYGADGLIELEDGGYLVAGFIQIVNGRSYDAILLRTDAEGQIEK